MVNKIHSNKTKSVSCLHNIVNDIKLDNMTNHELLSLLEKNILDNQRHQKFDIKNLAISNSVINEDDYKSLLNIISHCDHLKKFILTHDSIESTYAYEILKTLLYSKCLSSVVFSDYILSEDAIPPLLSALAAHKSLQNLDLSLDLLRDRGVKLFTEIFKDNESLTHINLSCDDFFAEGLLAIAQFLDQHRHITSLDLSYNLISAYNIKLFMDQIANNKDL